MTWNARPSFARPTMKRQANQSAISIISFFSEKKIRVFDWILLKVGFFGWLKLSESQDRTHTYVKLYQKRGKNVGPNL